MERTHQARNQRHTGEDDDVGSPKEGTSRRLRKLWGHKTRNRLKAWPKRRVKTSEQLTHKKEEKPDILSGGL